MGDEDRVPTSPIKPRPRPGEQWFFSACRELGGGRGPERGRGPEGGLKASLPPPPPPAPAQAWGAPASLPRAQRRSYRNSAGS